MADDLANADMTKKTPKRQPSSREVWYKELRFHGRDAAQRASVREFRPLQSWPMARHERQVDLDAIKATPSWAVQKDVKRK
jgi:hypothetical protein